MSVRSLLDSKTDLNIVFLSMFYEIPIRKKWYYYNSEICVIILCYFYNIQLPIFFMLSLK